MHKIYTHVPMYIHTPVCMYVFTENICSTVTFPNRIRIAVIGAEILSILNGRRIMNFKC